MSFRKNLEYLRKEKNYSQEDLAFKLNISRQSVSKWESGGAYPETDKMLSLCKIFECSLDELMNEDIVEIKKDKERRYSFNDLVNEVTDILKRSFHMFDSMNARSIFRYLFEMFVLFLVILLIHIPFNYLFELGYNVFINIPGDIAQLFISIWHLITEIVYIVAAFVFFMYIYKIRFLDKFEEANISEEKIEVAPKQEIKVKETKRVEIRNYDFGVFSIIGKIALFFIKSFIAFMSLPIIFLLLCTVAGVVIGVVLMFSEVFFIGALVFLLSTISFTVGLLYIIYNFIVNNRSNWQKLFLVFILSILGFGVGVGISLIEFSRMTISSEAPKGVESSVRVQVFEMKDDLLLQGAPSNIEYIVDNSLIDSVKIEATYYKVFTKNVIMETDVNDSNIYISSESKKIIKFEELYNILTDDLKDRTLSDYTILGQVQIKLYTSEENIQKLQEYIDRQNSVYYPTTEEFLNY